MSSYFERLRDRECVQEGVASAPGSRYTYYADRFLPAGDRGLDHYGSFRKIKRIGRFRAWAAAKVDHRADSLIPPMRALDQVYIDSFQAEVARSEEAINRWSNARQRWVLLERKTRCAKMRQQQRKERQRQREWGWDWKQRAAASQEG